MRDTHANLGDGSSGCETAVEAYLHAVAAADPTVLVRKAVRSGRLDDWFGDRERPRPIRVLALGKAAPRMVWGLVEASVPFSGLGVAPPGVTMPLVDTFRWLTGDHPIPGAASRAAGQAILDWIATAPPGPLLVLLSGGASACAEAPAPGVAWDTLVADTRTLLASGRPIEDVNARRAAWSALKGGRLADLARARGLDVRVWLLADTDPAQAAATVGSGPFARPGIPHDVLASSQLAADAAARWLGSPDPGPHLPTYAHGRRIAGDVEREVAGFVAAFAALPPGPVALVGHGEATVTLPPDAPPGGRCQHAALLAAGELAALGLRTATFLAAATDGVDGTPGVAGTAAGACVTAADASAAAAAGFDAQAWLGARGRLVAPGPTGTNVNDVWILLRR